jgi:hypothetical protein
MKKELTMNVSCLCGKTKFQAALKNHDVHACHCSMCRQQSSGVLMSIDVEPNSLKFDNQEYLKLFKSSDWGSVVFVANVARHFFGELRTAAIAISMCLRWKNSQKI